MTLLPGPSRRVIGIRADAVRSETQRKALRTLSPHPAGTGQLSAGKGPDMPRRSHRGLVAFFSQRIGLPSIFPNDIESITLSSGSPTLAAQDLRSMLPRALNPAYRGLSLQDSHGGYHLHYPDIAGDRPFDGDVTIDWDRIMQLHAQTFPNSILLWKYE
ncbi:hypothetical protein F4802DRAFT_593152 [Xylaria palmicola]|nr:hypothetical protein F4802DRAFT_593152 [Xylaria palmicola]